MKTEKRDANWRFALDHEKATHCRQINTPAYRSFLCGLFLTATNEQKINELTGATWMDGMPAGAKFL